MAAIEWLAALRRRWYLLVLAILCTGVAAWVVHSRPVSYQGCEGLNLSGPASATSSYLFGDPVYGNSSVIIAASIVTTTMMSQPMQQELGRSGVSNDYSVTMTNIGDPRFPTYSQPTVQICAPAPSLRGALQSIETVASQFRAVLHRMQSQQHVSPDSFINATVVFPPSSNPVIGRPSQAELGVLLIGLLVGITVTARADQFLRRTNTPRQ